MVVLNAPRSFIADDGLVHLFTHLFVYAVLGNARSLACACGVVSVSYQYVNAVLITPCVCRAIGIEIHQIYGGEFSIHRQLNKVREARSLTRCVVHCCC
jgi:hypothetical protein